jgi:hypothetical protein
LTSRVWKEFLEVFEQTRSIIEEKYNSGVDVLGGCGVA